MIDLFWAPLLLGYAVSEVWCFEWMKESTVTKRIIELANGKGGSQLQGNKKASLSQSLSFPSKGVHGNLMKQSLDATSVKSNSKKSLSNGKKSNPCSSDPSVTSDSIMDQSNGYTLGEVTSKETSVKKIGASARQSPSSESASRIKHSVVWFTFFVLCIKILLVGL